MKLRWQHKEEKTSVKWLQRYSMWLSSLLLYLAIFCFIFLLGLFCAVDFLLIFTSATVLLSGGEEAKTQGTREREGRQNKEAKGLQVLGPQGSRSVFCSFAHGGSLLGFLGAICTIWTILTFPQTMSPV